MAGGKLSLPIVSLCRIGLCVLRIVEPFTRIASDDDLAI